MVWLMAVVRRGWVFNIVCDEYVQLAAP